MVDPPHPTLEPEPALVYQIRLKGQLGQPWCEWFGGLSIAATDAGETLLTGPLADQAALHGLLRTIRDLGMPLISVNLLADAPPGGQ
jgi:hypothetical protein